MLGEINFKAPVIQILRRRALDKLRSWPIHEFLHMKRDWNQSADRLASTALQKDEGAVITHKDERRDLVTLNRLDELLRPKQGDPVAKITAITRSVQRRRHPPEVLQEELVQRIRSDRIRQAQYEEIWIVNLKKYLVGDVSNLSLEEAKTCAKIAPDYEIGENDLLFFCPLAKR